MNSCVVKDFWFFVYVFLYLLILICVFLSIILFYFYDGNLGFCYLKLVWGIREVLKLDDFYVLCISGYMIWFVVMEIYGEVLFMNICWEFEGDLERCCLILEGLNVD